MANLKLIVVTGAPFSGICVGCIGIQTHPETFQIIRDGITYTQYASSGDNYRLATQEDIERNWSTIYPHWTPEPGDNVIITEDYGTWANSKATIVEKDTDEKDYYLVERYDGYKAVFNYTSQMILAPYNITPMHEPKKESVTVKFLTEQQFKDNGLWSYSTPQGWNNMGEMNKYLGQSVVIPKSSIGSDGSFIYQDWTFKVSDYIITEWIPSKVDDFRDVSKTIASSSGPVGSSEPATRLIIKGASATINPDPLSLYEQKPIILKPKPKTKLKTI